MTPHILLCASSWPIFIIIKRIHAVPCNVEREREREEKGRERERGDGWSALIHELMRNIRWRNIGPPHLIPHRSLFWEQLCSTPGASLHSRLSLSLSLSVKDNLRGRSLHYFLLFLFLYQFTEFYYFFFFFFNLIIIILFFFFLIIGYEIIEGIIHSNSPSIFLHFSQKKTF
jgi:hypothetical protein